MVHKINAYRYLLISILHCLFINNTQAQYAEMIKLDNGNKIICGYHDHLIEWKDTSFFNPKVLIKNPKWYNIRSYSINVNEPNNMVVLFGLNNVSNKYTTQKQIQTDYFSVYRKQLSQKRNITYSFDGTLNLTLEKLIQSKREEEKEKLRTLIQSEFAELNSLNSSAILPTIFYESKKSLIIGISFSVSLKTLETTLDISSYSGFILLNNHIYGIIILLGNNENSYDQKKVIIQHYIEDLEKRI